MLWGTKIGNGKTNVGDVSIFPIEIFPKQGRPNCQGNQGASAVKTVRKLAIHGENSRLGVVRIGRKSKTSICRGKFTISLRLQS